MSTGGQWMLGRDEMRPIFAARRERFMRRMGGGVAVLFSAPVRHRNGDVDLRRRWRHKRVLLAACEQGHCERSGRRPSDPQAMPAVGSRGT